MAAELKKRIKNRRIQVRWHISVGWDSTIKE